MQEPRYISHLKQLDFNNPDSWIFQSNEEHQQGVAILAKRFASVFGCGNIGYVMGMLHDKGKEQKSFQNYIRKVSGFKADIKCASKTPHAYVGALVARKLYLHLYPILSYPIVSHHAGLYDSYDFNAKMGDEIPGGIELPQLSISEKDLFPSMKLNPDDFNHFIRLLFSCLVDADYLDTESFMNGDNYLRRIDKTSLCDLLPKLEAYLKSLSEKAPETALNRLRADIQQVCSEKSVLQSGFYSLTVPTGGGKTLSSLLWSIKHAVSL